MFNPKFLDEISAKLSEAVANSPAKDFEKNARALDRKSTRLNSSHSDRSRMPSSA